MALKIIDHDSAEYHEMVSLRDQILRKPLGLSFTKEELAKEKDHLLIAAYDDDQLMGCCMLVEEGKNVRLRQMAVVNDLQGKGIGRALMDFAENLSRDRGYHKITMHARKDAIGFYQKLGYVVVGGEFKELNIPHYKMEKKL